MARGALPTLIWLVLSIQGLVTADGLFSASSPVLDVTAKNYDSLIAKSNHTAIIGFLAPWCGHCNNLKPAYEKAAKNLKGLAKVGAVNCDEESNKAFCGQFGVKGFPTLKIVKPGKKPGKPIVEDYQGARDARAIYEAVSDKISNHVKRLKADALEGWISESTRPKAILFTEKGTTAALVKALAIDFLGSIDFAQVRNKEQAAVDKYEINKFPTILLLQGEHVARHDGEISKDALTKFLSQAASPNPDPAPKQAKAKSKATKKEKAASASAASSAKHKSSDFKDYLDHASTVILNDDTPTESPLPIVEHKEKPMVVADAPAALPTLSSSTELRSACLRPDSSHCVLILLPNKMTADNNDDGDAIAALSNFATVQDKSNKRKANTFPAYAIPAENEDSAMIREAAGLKSIGQLQVVVINAKKGWTKSYTKSAYDLKSIESFMDDIRFGEGTKHKLPAHFLTPLSDSAEQTEPVDSDGASDEPAAPSAGHDEL